MLVKYASAFVCMPGGLGTLDELTEVLTLIQTLKIKPFPVVLFDSGYWTDFLDWLRNSMLKREYITADDLELLRVCDKPDEAVEIVQSWYTKQVVTGRGVLLK